MSEQPRWIDGESANLEAAAEDALEWLKYLARYLDRLVTLPAPREEAGERLGRCIAALEHFLQGVPEEAGASPANGESER